MTDPVDDAVRHEDRVRLGAGALARRVAGVPSLDDLDDVEAGAFLDDARVILDTLAEAERQGMPEDAGVALAAEALTVHLSGGADDPIDDVEVVRHAIAVGP